MACEKDIWSIAKVKTRKIVWKTNWTSEFFLEPKSAKLQVNTVSELFYTFSMPSASECSAMQQNIKYK